MNIAEQGGPAFPCKVQWDGAGGITGAQSGQSSGWDTGMSMRDYFAAKAMTTMIAITMTDKIAPSELSEMLKRITAWSYVIADAMLEAREQGETA